MYAYILLHFVQFACVTFMSALDCIKRIWHTCWHLSRRLVTRFAQPQTHLPPLPYVFMIMAMIIPSSPTVFVQQLQNALATLAANCQAQPYPPTALRYPLGAHLARFELKIAWHSCRKAQVLLLLFDVVLAIRKTKRNETQSKQRLARGTRHKAGDKETPCPSNDRANATSPPHAP